MKSLKFKVKSEKLYYRLQNKMLFLAVVVLLCLPAFFLAHAQTSQSNCIVTKVGSPQGTPTACGSNTIEGNTYLAKAQQIKQAFEHCSEPPGAGTTFDRPDLGECLASYLKFIGFTDQQLSVFETRRKGSLWDSTKVPGGRCTECVGYISLVLAVIDNDARGITNQNGKAAESAGEINTFADGFYVGSSFYKRQGTGESIQIEPGDISIKGDLQDFGHILIVKKVAGAGSFVGYEANANFDCKVTDTREVLREQYTYYRRM